MNKKTIIILTIFILSTILGISIYSILSKDEKIENKEQSNMYISEAIEDECTEEYIEEQNVAKVASATEEKVSANAQLILKKYYKLCDHTTNEYVELPQELVNMTKKQVQAQYPDWEIIGFEKGKIILYKEFEESCGEHFKLKIEDGKINIYIVNENGEENIYQKTNISSEYLPEVDLINMQDGLEIYGKEELNKIIEDFE